MNDVTGTESAASEALMRRIVKLERQRNLFLFAGGLVAVLAFQGGPSDVTCKSLKVVDESGKEVFSVKAEQQGATLNVCNKDGKSVVYLSADSGGGGVIGVGNKDGKRRYAVGIDNDGGFTDWIGPDGVVRSTVFVSEQGFGELQHKASDGAVLAVLGVDGKSGGYFSVRGFDGKIRAFVEAAASGDGVIGVRAARDDKKRVLLGVSDDGTGTVEVYDNAGQVKARLP